MTKEELSTLVFVTISLFFTGFLFLAVIYETVFTQKLPASNSTIIHQIGDKYSNFGFHHVLSLDYPKLGTAE